jgi:hypothetical protein
MEALSLTDFTVAKKNGKYLVKTLAMRPLREYNTDEKLTRRKKLIFNNLQRQTNIKAISLVGSKARLRAWFPLRECRFKSCLRHCKEKGLTVSAAGPFAFLW